MSNHYNIINTKVCVDADKTAAVRINVTVGDNGAHAIQWLMPESRITDFSGRKSRCESLNKFITELANGDESMLAEMNEFTNIYTN